MLVYNEHVCFRGKERKVSPKKISVIVAAGVFVAILALAGCSGAQSSSGASPAADASSASASTDTTSTESTSTTTSDTSASAASTSATAASTDASAATSAATSAAAASTAAPAASATQANYIGEATALATALGQEGLTEAQCTGISIELDFDDPVVHYDISFKANGMEYDYDIDASTGAIIGHSHEIDDHD